MEQRESIMKLLTDEGDAITIYHALADRFGWQGTFFTREDVASAWNEMGYEKINDPHLDLPEDVWEKVQENWYWRRGIGERTTEVGWDLVHEAVREVVEEIK